MKTILFLQSPFRFLKVFADLKFSFTGFCIIKIQTSKKYFKQVHIKLHILLHILQENFSMKLEILESEKSLIYA